MVLTKKNTHVHRWVINNHGTVAIDFQYQKIRYRFNPVPFSRYSNSQDLAIASKIAGEIELAIKLGGFTGLEPWKQVNVPENQPKLSEKDLRAIWMNYTAAKSNTVAATSQNSAWVQVESALSKLEQDCYQMERLSADGLISALSPYYATSTCWKILTNLHSAYQLAIRQKLITVNPLAGWRQELNQSKPTYRFKNCYSIDEAKTIIQAFRSNQFCPKSSRYSHSHYADFVEFLFLTGVRPQMAIALTWGDIKTREDGSRVIVFSNGYTCGVLKESKTGRVVNYPTYNHLNDFLSQLPRNHDALVFPSQDGNHINLQNFTRRYWKTVVQGLVNGGELDRYLPTYHCRHSTATFLAQAGVSSQTIAALLDTSESMLNQHYFDNKQLTNVVLPDLLTTKTKPTVKS